MMLVHSAIAQSCYDFCCGMSKTMLCGMRWFSIANVIFAEDVQSAKRFLQWSYLLMPSSELYKQKRI